MRERILDFICKWAVVFLGTFAGIGSFVQMFHIHVSLPALIISEVFFSGLYLGCTLIKRKWLLFMISSISLLGILMFVLFQARQLINAIYFIANRVIDKNNEHFDKSVSHYIVIQDFKKEYVTVVFLLAVALCSYIITLVTYNRIYAGFHMLLLAVFVIPGTLFGAVPNIFYMVCIVIYVLLCIMFQHSRVLYMGRILFLTALCLAFLGGMLLISPVKKYQINDRYLKFANRVQHMMENIEFFKPVPGENPDDVRATGGVNGGKLGDVEEVNYTDTAMLEAELTKCTSPVYLKGYTASNYQGHKWYVVSAANIDIIRSVGLNYYNEALMYSPKIYNFTGDKKYIKINYVNAAKTFTYVPYYSNVLDNPKIKYDSGINTKSATRDSYEFDFYSMSEKDAIGKYNNHLKTDAEDYTEKMNLLMKQINLDLPADVVMEFRSKTNIKENMYDDTQESLEECIRTVREYLNKNTKYSLTPGALEEGQDYVLDFLFHKKKGYCTAYASAATLLLRYMGVPARYAEGYIVFPKGKADETGKITLSIRDNDAHAWTEVYVPGAGFVPIETTPGYYQTNDATPQDKGGVSEETTKQEQKDGEKETTVDEKKTEKVTGKSDETITIVGGETTTSQNSAGDTTGDSSTKQNKSSAKNIIIIATVVILLAASLLTYHMMKLNEKKKYMTEDNRHNVVVIGNLLKKNLEEIGIHYDMDSNTSDVCAQINDRIIDVSKERELTIDLRETKDVLDIIDKSRYAQSETDISAEEYKKVIKYYEDFKNSLQYLKNRV